MSRDLADISNNSDGIVAGGFMSEPEDVTVITSAPQDVSYDLYEYVNC